MPGLPTACTNCERAFSSDARGARLSHLEFDQALCDRCVWLVEHPETSSASGRDEARQAA
jgi:hypothetical protein